MQRLYRASLISLLMLSFGVVFERLHWQVIDSDAFGVTRKGSIVELRERCAFLDDKAWVEWKVLDDEISYCCSRLGNGPAPWPLFKKVRSKRIPFQYKPLLGSS